MQARVPELPPGRPALARRLRELRETRWPDITLTQAAMAEALGGDSRLGVSTISSWESTNSLTTPTRRRLRAYATFFATRRSVDGGRPRVLPDEDLDDTERAERDRLYDELLALRDPAIGLTVPAVAPSARNSWRFPDGRPVRLVCGTPPERVRAKISHPYGIPSNPNYIELLSFADTDAMVELFGHVRAMNPASDVRFLLSDELEADDLSGHVILLGGLTTRWFPDYEVGLPVRQTDDPRFPDGDVFELVADEGQTRFCPVFTSLSSEGELSLVEDVGMLVRRPNPHNTAATLTLCNGVYGRGVLGAVRCLTDLQLRDRNEAYLTERFGDSDEFGILMRVQVRRGRAVTPDLHNPYTVLYAWS